MREKQVEQKLVKAVRTLGGICPKFVSPGMAGMPDRLILLPGGRIGDIRVRLVMEKHYLCFLPWAQIAEEMHYSLRWVRATHKAGLEEVQRMLEEAA